jgi:hypothetical protein
VWFWVWVCRFGFGWVSFEFGCVGVDGGRRVGVALGMAVLRLGVPTCVWIWPRGVSAHLKPGSLAASA